MRSVVLGIALAFVALLGFLTVFVIVVNRSVGVLEAISLLVLGIIGFGIIGALTNPPGDR